jgi:hypothetical protein
MTTPKNPAAEFLRDHYNADEIVVDTTTGLPFKAVYSVLDSTGNRRTRPAEFYFSQRRDA